MGSDLERVRDWLRGGEYPGDGIFPGAIKTVADEWLHYRLDGMDTAASLSIDELVEIADAMRGLL